MSINNTTENYGIIAKWLHWVTAVFFLAAYVSVYYRQWFTYKDTPENWTALQLHLSVGVSLMVLIFLRVLWRSSQSSPWPEPGTLIEHLATRFGHWLLYVMMIIMPLTGYMGTRVETDFFFWFEVPKFEDTVAFQLLVTDILGMTFQEFEIIVDDVHKTLGAFIVPLLIGGHVAAALYHHFVRKDRVLYKITTNKPRP